MTETPEETREYTWRTLFLLVVVAGIGLAVYGIPRIAQNPSSVTTPVPTGWFAQHGPVWTTALDERVVTTPLIAEDRAVIPAMSSVYALDLADGHVLWRAMSPHQNASYPPPVLAESHILVIEVESRMSAYALADGSLLWQACPVSGSPTCKGHRIDSMVVSPGYVTIAEFISGCFTYRIDTGGRVWSGGCGKFDAIGADDHNLYVERSEAIDVLSLEDGTLIRSIPHKGGALGQFIIDSNRLFLVRWGGGDTGQVESYSLSNDKRIWSVEVPVWGKLVWLAYADGILYASADRVYALDADSGEMKWQSETIDSPGRAVVSDGLVFVRNDDRTLYAFDKDTGEKVGTLGLHNTVNHYNGYELNPAITDGLLIVPVGSRQIFSYRP